MREEHTSTRGAENHFFPKQENRAEDPRNQPKIENQIKMEVPQLTLNIEPEPEQFKSAK